MENYECNYYSQTLTLGILNIFFMYLVHIIWDLACDQSQRI